jgi:hypothetical protein
MNEIEHLKRALEVYHSDNQQKEQQIVDLVQEMKRLNEMNSLYKQINQAQTDLITELKLQNALIVQRSKELIDKLMARF